MSFYFGDCLHWYKTIYALSSLYCQNYLCQLTFSLALAFGAPFAMLIFEDYNSCPLSFFNFIWLGVGPLILRLKVRASMTKMFFVSWYIR